MQQTIEDIVAKRTKIVDEVVSKKLQEFLKGAEDTAEGLTYKVIESHADRVVERVQTLMSEHTVKQTATMLDIQQGEHPLQIERLREQAEEIRQLKAQLEEARSSESSDLK